MATRLNRPVRILHVLEATEGGTRRWLCDVLRGLDAEAFAQDCIVSLKRDGRFEEVIEALRHEGHRCWVVDMERSVHPVKDALSLRHVVRIARTSGCDVIHGHSAKGGMFARLTGRLLGKPAIYTPHAFSFLEASPKSKFYMLAEKAARRWTALLHAVSASEAEAAAALGYPTNQIRLVPNGVRACTAPTSHADPLKVIGAIGSLRTQKSPETFLEAARILCARRPDLRFVWAGDGPLRQQMVARVEKLRLPGRVAFVGHVDDADAFMRGVDVFVQCSRYEGMSYAVLDAMAMAKPIVATEVPGNADAIEDGYCGLLVPPRSPEVLARAIEQLVDCPDEAARLGICARERAMHEFSLESQLDGLATLYEEAATGGSS